jgi:hypothetical protein
MKPTFSQNTNGKFVDVTKNVFSSNGYGRRLFLLTSTMMGIWIIGRKLGFESHKLLDFPMKMYYDDFDANGSSSS